MYLLHWFSIREMRGDTRGEDDTLNPSHSVPQYSGCMMYLGQC